MNPGSIVRCRNRDWILLPSESSAIYRLRPLTGAMDEIVEVHIGLCDLVGYDLQNERLTHSKFAPPTADDLSSAMNTHLLWQASRLTLREGASPFRSLGKISIRPRIYQFVPLLMALRLEPIRLLIADDVGVGKTVEALLIARELYERGEIKRICVLCPPNLLLCEHWQKELSNKFNLDAVIIRSGTVGQLERRKIGQDSIYKYYPIQVASIDFLKSDRNRNQFLIDCPDFIIVDEAHGAAYASENNKNRHQRHQFIQKIAERENQHLVLLTATPHSGIEGSFRSLISFLQPGFREWNTSDLSQEQRIELAKYFVQRTRKDIIVDWEGEHCFPNRVSEDKTYRLSKDYLELFEKTFNFCSAIVESGQSLSGNKRRVRNWGALALMSCVMSSPAAAVAALKNREAKIFEDDSEPDFQSWIFESNNEQVEDDQPVVVLESAESTLSDREKRQLREFARLAEGIVEDGEDKKLEACADAAAKLLRDGYNPIVWCRYVATSEYVAQGLQKRLQREFKNLQVQYVNGLMGDDERKEKINSLVGEDRRILVSTDCLSEGINLQGGFNAVIHYDLPWNPNRLEQREGRVDRYGQLSDTVQAIRLYSPDNPVDGAVLDVLLNKAKEIHHVLGTYVPVPDEADSVTETLLNALFRREKKERKGKEVQYLFDFGGSEIDEFHAKWDREVEREHINRTRFAQRAIKPEEVRQEIENTDAVLGDPDAVREFVLSAAQKLQISYKQIGNSDVFEIPVGRNAIANLPTPIQYALSDLSKEVWKISFTSPTPANAEYLGRNHPFVTAMARFLFEEALTRHGKAKASRCGVIRTNDVSILTTLLLLRVRYLIEIPNQPSMLSEEVITLGYTGQNVSKWLEPGEALRLLAHARASEIVPNEEKRERIQTPIDLWKDESPLVMN